MSPYALNLKISETVYKVLHKEYLKFKDHQNSLHSNARSPLICLNKQISTKLLKHLAKQQSQEPPKCFQNLVSYYIQVSFVRLNKLKVALREWMWLKPFGQGVLTFERYTCQPYRKEQIDSLCISVSLISHCNYTMSILMCQLYVLIGSTCTKGLNLFKTLTDAFMMKCQG